MFVYLVWTYVTLRFSFVVKFGYTKLLQFEKHFLCLICRLVLLFAACAVNWLTVVGKLNVV